MLNLSNINPNEQSRITGFTRRNFGMKVVNDIPLEMYIIKFNYNDGTSKFIRVFCEYGTSQMLPDDRSKTEFFVNRLFGSNGLIVKEGRNDYIYLGGVYDNGRRTTRFNRTNTGKTMQEEFDEYFKSSILPKLTLQSNPSDYDLIDMEYHFHTGKEDMNEIFSSGLFCNYGHSFGPSFTSTFYPAELNDLPLVNNLADAARAYGNDTAMKGSRIFITRVPKKYKGLKKTTGGVYPPMPTMKTLDASKNESLVIPEIIYGMYDLESGILYKNPNYNEKYNPNGLTYDHETINKIDTEGIAPDLVHFMKMRRDYNYDQLKLHDDKHGIFDQYCQYYGISVNPTYDNIGRRGRR